MINSSHSIVRVFRNSYSEALVDIIALLEVARETVIRYSSDITRSRIMSRLFGVYQKYNDLHMAIRHAFYYGFPRHIDLFRKAEI